MVYFESKIILLILSLIKKKKYDPTFGLKIFRKKILRTKRFAPKIAKKLKDFQHKNAKNENTFRPKKCYKSKIPPKNSEKPNDFPIFSLLKSEKFRTKC